eukprot:7232331-Alexandrium_andersonii.AAC.1
MTADVGLNLPGGQPREGSSGDGELPFRADFVGAPSSEGVIRFPFRAARPGLESTDINGVS